MSILKTKYIQIGNDLVANNNFTLYQPALPDGTMRIGYGNPDGLITDVMSIANTGVISVGSGIFEITGNTVFSSLRTTGNTTLGNSSDDVLTVNGGSLVFANNVTISGNTTFSNTVTISANTSVTNLSSSGVVSGTGFSTYLASPPAIGGSSPAAGNFTSLGATGNVTLGDGAGDTVTINGGTANGVAYLNGSKVLTTGSALTFDGTKFTQTASTAGVLSEFKNSSSANQNGNIVASNDTGAAVRVQVFGSAAGSYGMLAAGSPVIYTSAADLNLVADNASGVIKFGLNGSAEQMRLTNTGLGIGTSSPDTKLTVSKTNDAGDIITLKGANSVNGAIGVHALSNGGVYLQADSTRDIRFKIGSTYHATLDSSGNLGLGVTPSAWTTGFKAIQISSLSTLYQDSASNTILSNNSENVGNVNKYITTAGASLYLQNAGQHLWFTAPSGAAGNPISFGDPKMTLTAAGDLGIGTASPGAKLDVNGSIWAGDSLLAKTASSVVYIRNLGGVNRIDSYNWPITAHTPLLFNASNITFTIADADRAFITSAGNWVVPATYSNNVGAVRQVYVDSSGNYGYNASLRETKTNIVELNSVDWLYDLNPVSFNYREKDESGEYTDEAKADIHYGLIADDVESVNKELCTYSTEGKLEGVRYDLLVPALLKAFQELSAKVTALETKVN